MGREIFTKVLKQSWNANLTADSLETKIRGCGGELSRWSSREFGSIRKRKKELMESLKELQNSESPEIDFKQIHAIECEIDQVLKHEETMWFKRSRAIWLKDGDRNS